MKKGLVVLSLCMTLSLEASMLVIAHRGASGYEPENTLAAFKKALEFNVDYIEFDVHTCKTGEVVIIHDHKIPQGRVKDLSFDELRVLDVGKGQQIPTLQEALDCINKKAIVNIELKGERTAEPVAAIVHDYINKKSWDKKDFLITSFDHLELKKFAHVLPQIPTGVLLFSIPVDYVNTAQTIGSHVIIFSQTFINQEVVDFVHENNLKVFVYTVNDEDDIQEAKQLNVDGIITDFPDRV